MSYKLVRFQSYIEQDHIDSLNKFHKWYKCPVEECKTFYLSTQLNDMINHIVERWFEKSHFVCEWWIDDETLNMYYFKPYYAVKKDKYYRLNSELRKKMFFEEA